MQIGVDSFAAVGKNLVTGETLSAGQRLANLLEEIEAADRAGLDAFGLGEHHRQEFLDSAPTMLLAAAAARTSTIRLTSAVTVLSAADPVRVFQQFATLDLLSKGRAEIVAGRGPSSKAFHCSVFALRTMTPSSLKTSSCSCFSVTNLFPSGRASTVPRSPDKESFLVPSSRNCQSGWE